MFINDIQVQGIGLGYEIIQMKIYTILDLVVIKWNKYFALVPGRYIKVFFQSLRHLLKSLLTQQL